MHLSKINQFNIHILCIVVAIYIGGFYLLSSSKQNTIFYLSSLFCIIIFAFFYFKAKQRKITYDSHYIVLSLIFIMTLLSCFWSGQRSLNNVFDVAKNIFFLCILLTSSGIIIHHSSISKHINLLYYFILLAAGFSALITIYPYHDSRISERLTHRTLFSFSSNPINTATYFSLAFLTCIFLYQKKDNILKKTSLLILASLFFYIVIMTQSRGALLSLIICSITAFSILKSGIITACSFLSVCILTVIIIPEANTENVIHRFKEPNYRFDIWTSAFYQIKEHIIGGLGYGKHPIPLPTDSSILLSHSHNFIIENMRILGVPATILFILMNLSIVYTLCKRQLKESQPYVLFFLIWFTLGTACLLTNGRFIVRKPSYEWFCYWVPFSFLIAEHALLRYKSKHKVYLSSL